MKIIASTQFYENYGAHAWDGTGECPQYWKAKGGDEYLVADVTVAQVVALGQTGMKALVDQAKAWIESNDDYSREYIIDWDVVEDDYLTQFQKDCLRYEGKYDSMGALKTRSSANKLCTRLS
jgi:hypothetical protein